MCKHTALAALLAFSGVANAAELSVQEALLRAKPAVALVMSEVTSEVVLTCPSGGAQRVVPIPFRETGTGWFISPSGWMITNAHVVATTQQPQRWIADQQGERAARQACGDDLGRQALAAILARAKVKLEPSLYVLLSNGVRLPATVAKYNPPAAATMSGRDLALLKLEAADMPTLVLGDSSNAKLGDKLHILGFPGVVLSHELLNASNKVEASVTNGAISGFKQDITNQPVIQVGRARRDRPGIQLCDSVVGSARLHQGHRGPARREEPIQRRVARWPRGLFRGQLLARREELHRSQPAPPRTSRCPPADGGSEESTAPPVPVGDRCRGRDGGESRRSGRRAGDTLEAQPISDPPLRGAPAHRDFTGEADHPGRARRRDVHEKSRQDPGITPRRAGRARGRQAPRD
ncbi:MAG: hypothetical protein DME07_15800 [Candidatus Rokuibacteriota bacterium]|nr:MAG: hypothetical protein DME07_15800 [Candidatus Rokubacteria bacterium]